MNVPRTVEKRRTGYTLSRVLPSVLCLSAALIVGLPWAANAQTPVTAIRATDFLNKPFTPPLLNARVASCYTRSQLVGGQQS